MTTHWDGSVRLLHADGSSTIAVWPVQIQESGANPAVPIDERCARIARGAPYVSSHAQAPSKRPQFEDLKSVSLREFSRTEVERTDPCASEFGSQWHAPAGAEFDAYATHLARAGSWFVRDASGTMRMLEYAPPIQLQIAGVTKVPAQIRPSLAGTAHVFCLRTASGAKEPQEPSSEEIERCVHQFYAPRHDTMAVDLPDFGRSHMLAVRQACHDNGPDAEWLRILESTRPKVSELVESLIAPQRLENPLDQKTMSFLAALFWTMQICIERTLHPSARSNSVTLSRLKELEMLLSNANDQSDTFRRARRPVETSEPVAIPLPEPLPQTKAKRCNCAESDLACNMRCAARH